jgi:hypothetical protein
MIYLLHLNPGLRRSNGAIVNHYLGWCHEGRVLKRLEEHRKGKGRSKLIQAALRAGSTIQLVATWAEGTPSLERYLKDRGHLKMHCPICRPAERARATSDMAARRNGSRGQLPTHSPAQPKGNGTGSAPPNPGAAPSASGTSHPGPQPGSSTSSGETDGARAPGGNSSAATAPRNSQGGTRFAGTKQRSRSGSGKSGSSLRATRDGR